MDYSKVVAALNGRWIKEMLVELPTARFWGVLVAAVLIVAICSAPAILHAIAPNGLIH